MIKLDEQLHIKSLLAAGYSVPDVARKVGRSTATIYKYQNSVVDGIIELIDPVEDKPYRVSAKLEPFIEYMHARMNAGVHNSSKLYEELLLKGYEGNYHLVNAYMKDNRVRFLEDYTSATQQLTGPGEQAQVDWGSFGKVVINGKEEKLYAFVYVLSYSRMLYVEFVVRQNQKTLQECHMHAFEKWGIPKVIVYDNMKTAVVSREKTSQGDKIHFNPALADFAQYYNFELRACHPYHPRSKGKVEAGVKYVRNNFMDGMIPRKEFTSLEDLNGKATEWVENIANQRKHGTTKEKPYDMWLLEKNHLQFPDVPPYITSMLTDRFSTKDGRVQYKTCFYSVPREYRLRKLSIRDISCHGLPIVEIYHENRLIATHNMSYERGKYTWSEEHLVKPMRKGIFHSHSKTNVSVRSRRPHIEVPVRDLRYYNLLIPQTYVQNKSQSISSFK